MSGSQRQITAASDTRTCGLEPSGCGLLRTQAAIGSVARANAGGAQAIQGCGENGASAKAYATPTMWKLPPAAPSVPPPTIEVPLISQTA